jgi:hypothetical protein
VAQRFLRLLKFFERGLPVGESIERQLPLRQSFLAFLCGLFALDKLDFHIDFHRKYPEDPANKGRLSTDIVRVLSLPPVDASCAEAASAGLSSARRT